MKKMFLLAIVAVSLTGCIVAPYDDHPRHSDRNGHNDRKHSDRKHSDRDWDKQHRPHWDNRSNSSHRYN